MGPHWQRLKRSGGVVVPRGCDQVSWGVRVALLRWVTVPMANLARVHWPEQATDLQVTAPKNEDERELSRRASELDENGLPQPNPKV